MQRAIEFEHLDFESMFDMLLKPGLSSEFQSSLSSSVMNSTLIVESKSSHDNRGVWMGRVDDEGGLHRLCASDVEDDDGLELSLGLSVGGPLRTKKSSKQQKEPSGNFSLCTESPTSFRRETSKGELSVGEHALPVDVNALQNMSHGRKDEQNCEGASSQTHDQVWETLKKGKLVSSQDSMHVEGAAALQELKHASAFLWGRRSNSMQLMGAMKEGSDGTPHPIRRLSSNGASVNMNMLPQLFDSAPAPLSRQVSSVESLLEKGSETACPQRQEALERQRKIEQQALRRQEARRRRKCLIVEKQNKKARKDDRCLSFDPRSRASTSPQKISPPCADTQDSCFLLGHVNDTHHRLVNKETLQTTSDKSGVLRVSCFRGDNEHVGGMNAAEEARLKPRHLDVSMESSAERKVRRVFVEDHVVDMEAPSRSDSCVDLQSFHSEGLEHECTKGKMRTVCPPSTQGAVPVRKAATDILERNFPVGFSEAAGKICHSSTSETESGDTNEEHSTVQNEGGEVDALSSKYANTEGSQSVGSGLSFPSMNSLSYPPPFPVLPIPYPISVPGASPAAIPLQLGFSLPCFMQYSTTGGGESSIPSSSQMSTSFSVQGSATLPPYRFPLPDGTCPWFPVVPATQPARSQSPKGSPVAKPPSSEFKGEPSIGKRPEDPEKSAISDSSVALIQRTISKSISKDQAGTLLPLSPKRVECQASTPISHRKAGGPSSMPRERRKESPSVNWVVPIERQHSLPVATQLEPQDVASVEQPSNLPGGEAPCKNELRPNKLRKCGSRNFSAVVKQDEVSAESQLASENSGPEASIEQPVMVDGQKSASIPELPWVSTTGVGPNGKTISGVMYISSRRQIRLVCSCHGKHMSPAEFVEHSGSIDLSNPERNILVNPFPFLSQVAMTPI